MGMCQGCSWAEDRQRIELFLSASCREGIYEVLVQIWYLNLLTILRTILGCEATRKGPEVQPWVYSYKLQSSHECTGAFTTYFLVAPIVHVRFFFDMSLWSRQSRGSPVCSVDSRQAIAFIGKHFLSCLLSPPYFTFEFTYLWFLQPKVLPGNVCWMIN